MINSTLKLINGECLQELAKLESNSIDMVMVDIPYWRPLIEGIQ